MTELTSIVFCPSYYNSSQGNVALLPTSASTGFPLGYVVLYKAVTLRKSMIYCSVLCFITGGNGVTEPHLLQI